MKRAPWYLAAGAVAGFAGVLAFHGQTAVQSNPAGHTQPSQQPGSSSTGSPGGGAPTGSQTATGGAHSATGPIEQYGYGELAVRVSVSGNRITNVTVPTLQTAEAYSQQLAQQVIPMLRSQVLAADGPHINGVSGATYTSQAYATSLQAALDALHVS
jgi:uncharacterized protein with FMN-binding domain